MITIGIAWLLFWGLVDVFGIEQIKAALVTGVVFVLLGLVLGERPWNRA